MYNGEKLHIDNYSLDLSGTGIQQAGNKAIVEAMKQNTSIITLQLNKNVAEEDAKVLKEILDNRTPE